MLKWIFKTCASSCESGYCPKPPKYPLKIWLFRALVDWVSLEHLHLSGGTFGGQPRVLGSLGARTDSTPTQWKSGLPLLKGIVAQ